MSKQNKEPYSILNGKDIELISIKGDEVYMKIMEYSEAVMVMQGTHPTIKKKAGWTYLIYQLGNSQFKNVKTLN